MKLFSDSLSFYKACFHCHTTESDGKLDPASVVAFYENAGYDIIAVTEHRRVTQVSGTKALMLPGIEIDYTLPGQWVHILGLGMKPEISGLWESGKTPQDGIDLIRSLGGAAVLAHPAWSLNTPAFMRSLTGLSGVEIWNSVSTLPLNGDRADSSSLLDVTWASGGKPIPVFACDDSHPYRDEAGVAATMVQAEDLSVASVMSALKAGRFYATTGPKIFQVENRDNREIVVRCSPAESVIFYSDSPWAAGRTVIRHDITECSYTVQSYDCFVRIEVRDAAGRKAWSPPVIIREPETAKEKKPKNRIRLFFRHLFGKGLFS